MAKFWQRRTGGERPAEPTGPPTMGTPRAAGGFPHVAASQRTQLERCIRAFESSRTVAGTQGPSEDLARLSGSAGWDPERSIWKWFGAWCERAVEFGAAETAVVIAEFTRTFHEHFAPNAGAAAIFFGKANAEQLARIYEAAFDACAHVDPQYMLSTPGGEIAVGEMWADLSLLVGRPIPLRAPVGETPDERVEKTFERAFAGDETSVLRIASAKARGEGNNVGALELLERAARLGDVDAMHEAGDVSRLLARDGDARFWYRAGAEAGDARSAYELGILDHEAGDVGAAKGWFELAGERGLSEGFAALARLASDVGDEEAELMWIERGAHAGQPFCLTRHALNLLRRPGNERSNLQEAARFAALAGEGGDPQAMLYAGIALKKLNEHVQAKTWFDRARATKDPETLRDLEQIGF